MRKTIFAILIATAAMARAEIGRSAFNMGPYTATATNSNYATTVGYASGYMANGLTRSTLLGGASGRHGYSWMRCVGLGYGALDGASNCTDCVAIGDKAGARWRNANGWVQVGNGFAYTNGYLNIGNGAITRDTYGTIRIGPTLTADGNGAYVGGNIYANGEAVISGDLTVNSVIHGAIQTTSIEADAVRLVPNGNGATIELQATQDGRIAVLVGGTPAGYLTITPAQE